MGAVGDSGEQPPSSAAPPSSETMIPAGTLRWLERTFEQARLYKAGADEAAFSALRAATTRLSEIGSTASAHSQYTLEIAKGFVEEGEELAFSKLKEGVLIAAAHPEVSCGVAVGVGMFGFKRPRRALYLYVKQLLVNEESLLSSAEARAKSLQQSFANMKHEGKKLEERASMAENDFLTGRTRLRHAGQQIRALLSSNYKIEKQTRGLKDLFQELPKKDASLFRSKVSSLTTDVKRDKKSLGKEVSKITGYGISV